MTKLCPRGKAAAKRKFKVYPSAYANAYASRICAGKIKDPSGVKRKDFRGSKAEGGRIGYKGGTELKKLVGSKETQLHADSFEKGNERAEDRAVKETMQEYKKMAKGGRVGLRGGGICKKGMNRKAIGKNS